MFSIGEFSQITGMTVKTLRFYHEQELLIPRVVDQSSGYRYYDEGQIEAARAIVFLRSLEFPLSHIKEILRHEDDAEFLILVARQKAVLEGKIKQFQGAIRSLEKFMAEQELARVEIETYGRIEEITQAPILVAAIRMKGRYRDCGKAFGRIGRSFGHHISGKPLLLHYDDEFKEDDADFEACMPVRIHRAVDGIAVRELPGGRIVSLEHRGPYEQLGRSYAKILAYVKRASFAVAMPTREVYHRGPGMIFRGNPRNYVTEIQIPVDGGGKANEKRDS